MERVWGNLPTGGGGAGGVVVGRFFAEKLEKGKGGGVGGAGGADGVVHARMLLTKTNWAEWAG